MCFFYIKDAFGGVVTIGEGRIAVELKRSNDCLSSRIELLEKELTKQRHAKNNTMMKLSKLKLKLRNAKQLKDVSVSDSDEDERKAEDRDENN